MSLNKFTIQKSFAINAGVGLEKNIYFKGSQP